ncbi:hypothetical protein [Mariniflexile sp.]|uniref:hypothetical protein n=1 Tax=Mariniflexile sp. TaxID=1979402 RepID=UPI0040481BBB
MGCSMINPNILENYGFIKNLFPRRFAFRIHIDRSNAMLSHQMGDILLSENNVRFNVNNSPTVLPRGFRIYFPFGRSELPF